MAKNRIDPGQIGRRLGLSGGSSGEPNDPRSGDSSSSGNTLFASAFAILIAGVGGLAASDRGAEFRHAVWEHVMGPPPDTYQSRVAGTCDKGWKDNRFNRDQIHCYMTRDVARLCEPRERRALANKLLDYQAAMDRSAARLNVVALRMIVNPGETWRMGIAEARSRDPNLSEQERAAQFDKSLGIAHDILSPVDQINQDNVNTATKEVLVADVKNLVEHGYLASTDFTSTQPKIVKEGLASAGPVGRSSCR